MSMLIFTSDVEVAEIFIVRLNVGLTELIKVAVNDSLLTGQNCLEFLGRCLSCV